MPSFDIISEVDETELKNSVENSIRELATRFDFRGVTAHFEQIKEDVKLTAESDFQIQQMVDIFRGNLAKRGVDANALDLQDIIHSGKTYSQLAKFKQGIETDVAKKITKLIKESKIKVQAIIQGDQVRVTGKKRDDLQQIMQLIKSSDLGQPFQFKNFKD